MSRRRYSQLILDEAVALAAETNLAHASDLTGVNQQSIRQHARKKLIAQNKTEEARRRRKTMPKYTDAQKIECVNVAMKLKQYLGQRKAFIEAGRRLGMNGRSVEMQAQSGLIPGITL